MGHIADTINRVQQPATAQFRLDVVKLYKTRLFADWFEDDLCKALYLSAIPYTNVRGETTRPPGTAEDNPAVGKYDKIVTEIRE